MRPEERVAAVLVDRYDLKPPVDIHTLVRQFADFEICDWSYRCDGVVVLSTLRPRIFIGKNDNPRRERFTVAHELGHVVLGWHVDTVYCDPSPEGDTHARPLGVNQEGEANRFASHLMVPDRFLDQFRGVYVNPAEALAELEAADLSAAAGVLALARALLPGYVFKVPGLKKPVLSSGTRILSDHRGELKRLSVRADVHCHQGQWIEWFQLADIAKVGAMSNAVEAKQLLALSLKAARPELDHDALAMTVNGMVGAALSGHAITDPDAIFGMLKYRFSTSQYADLLLSEEFVEYLRMRSVLIGSRRQ